MFYCVSRPRRLRGPDGNAWRAGFWPAGCMLDTPDLNSMTVSGANHVASTGKSDGKNMIPN